MPDPITEFIEAFNGRDLDRFVAALHPEVEIHAMRGLRRGLAEAREWATRPPGGVQQEIVVEGRVTGYEGGELDGPVIVNVERRWHWDEDGSFAGQDELAWVFNIEQGKVRMWRPFEDREAAVEFAAELPRSGEPQLHELD